MTQLVYDVYPNSNPRTGSRLVRLTSADLELGTTAKPQRRGAGTGMIVTHPEHPAVTAGYLARGNYVRVIDLDISDEVVAGIWLRDGEVTVLSGKEKGGKVFAIGGNGPLDGLRNATVSSVARSPSGSVWDQFNIDAYGRWRFGVNAANLPNGETFGGILKRMIYEAFIDVPTGIPWLANDASHLSLTQLAWSDIHDSNGAAWPSTNGLVEIQVGENLLDHVAKMMAQGIDLRMDPDTFVISAYIAGTDGTDRSSGSFASGKVRFVGGVNIGADLKKAIHDSAYVSHMLVIGNDGKTLTTVVDPGWSVGDEVVRGSMQMESTSDLASMGMAGAQQIELRKLATDQATFPYKPGATPLSGQYTPGLASGDYWLGDVVTLHTGTSPEDYNNQPIIVAAVEYQFRAGGDWGIQVELGSSYMPLRNGVLPAPAGMGVTQPGMCCGPQFCVAVEGGSGTYTEEDFLDWDSGAEHWVNTYLGATGPVLTQSDYVNIAGGVLASGIYGGGFTGGGGDPGRVVTPGTTLRISGYSAGYGLSYFGPMGATIDFSWGIEFKDSSGVSLGVHVVGAHSTPQDYGFVGPDSLDVVVPATAAYMVLRQGIDPGLTNQQGNTHLDSVSVGTVTAGSPSPTTTRYTGSDPCVKHGDAVNWDAGPIAGRPSATSVPVNTIYYSSDTNTIYYSDGDTWQVLITVGSSTDMAIEEEDGSPTGSFTTLKVPNGRLTDNGDGSASLSFRDVIVAHGSMGATETMDADDGTYHYGTLNADLALTLAGVAGSSLIGELVQDGTGGRALTLSANVINRTLLEAAYDTTAGTTMYLVAWTRDGTNWMGGWFGSAGAAVAALNDLTDVTISSPAAADQLRYDGSEWVNSNLHWEPMTDYDGLVMLDSAGGLHMHEVSN